MMQLEAGMLSMSKSTWIRGGDVDAKDNKGWTPLNLAAHIGRTEIGEILIAKGADVNARDERGWTSLYIAALEGRKENVELLISAGANINAKSKSRNSTPLDEAIRRKHSKIIDFLRENGAKEGEELEGGEN